MPRWKPAGEGRPAAHYRVCASDERGFSVSDTSYRRLAHHRGDSRSARLDEETPPNFVAEKEATEQGEVVGVGLSLPNANRAYYRVVAVDERGNRGGPSDPAQARCPFVYTAPVTEGRVGEAYIYAARTIVPLGQPTLRLVEGVEVVSRWDAPEPQFALRQGPSWLRVDAETGVLRGLPNEPGTCRAVLEVALRREVRKVDPARLVSGREEVISLARETQGLALQVFDVAVRA